MKLCRHRIYIRVPGEPGNEATGPGRSPSLVSFPDSIGTHVLLCVYDVHGAASDMAHSAACSSCASQSSPTRRPIAETPHQSLSFPFPKRPFGKKNVVYRSFLALVAIASCILIPYCRTLPVVTSILDSHN